MPKRVLALGLDPAFVDLTQMPGLTPALVLSFIEEQLDRIRALGYEVTSCLVDVGATAELMLARHLESRTFDCVLIGAGLRAAPHLRLFDKLLNLVHERAPRARICFNTSPADSAEAVRRWICPCEGAPARRCAEEGARAARACAAGARSVRAMLRSPSFIPGEPSCTLACARSLSPRCSPPCSPPLRRHSSRTRTLP
jgi:hypothetical protein